MKPKHEKGFSLIELLIVVVIVGLIAAIAIPYLQKAVGRAENGNAYASLKTLTKAQLNYFSLKGRYARLDELNAAEGNTLGITSGNQLRRGVFTLAMSPATPTDTELENNFQVIATKATTVSNTPCVLSVDASGYVDDVFSYGCVDFGD
ncbi:MAG: prepilin-type N-terminal cleavage/methylation domain-containing protein [Acidobacteriota bacterium]|nr:prepilin-type N-terminal cleavage/methylation domain-containing protein [Acidobacteriota bacterium]MDH3531196.1 prepilin-type N-terminal cleavage/methylation domain-containing protein [Acidobacteriota bacterium]